MSNSSTAIVSTESPHDTTNNNSEVMEESMEQQQDEFPRYQKRSGTTDHGKEFEYLVCTYYSLKLLNDPNVDDFKMTTNSKVYGDLDDIELTITYSDQTKHTFLMQLKHTESSERALTDKMLNNNKNFRLQKYFNSFKNLKSRSNISCILFTNRETQIANNTTVSLDFAKVTSAQCHLNNAKCVLLDTTGNINSCYHFELEQQQEHSADEREFFQCFSLLTSQKNYKEIKALIDEMLSNMFGCEIEFTTFMQQWWQSNFVLSKHDVIVKLAELALSPFIQEISENVDKSLLEKSKPLRNAITKFQMTLVKDYYKDTIGKIWAGISDKPENRKKASLKYGITSTSKILWYLNKVPLIVKYDDKKDKRIQGAIRLLEKEVKKMKIIMLTNETKEEFPKWKIFENLHDLQNEEIECYNDIIENFKISLQGRPSIYLKQLFDSNLEIADAIEVRQLLLMIEEDFCVRKKAEELPEAYIPRSISTLILDTEKFLDYTSLEGGLLIINYSYNTDIKDITNLSKYVQTIYFEDFLSQVCCGKKIKNDVIVLATDNKCTKSNFEEICKRYKERTIYLIQIIDKNCSMLVQATGNISSLKTMQYKDDSLKEDQLYSVFQNPVNIIIGQPGIGKSTLLRYLSQNCPGDCWCVLVNLIQYSEFLREVPSSNEILDEFLKNDCPFFDKTKKQFQQSGRLYLLLDGLDEIQSDCIKTVLDFVEDLSSTGIKFWISSRENLKETIVKQFNTFTIDIQEVTQEEQRKYIHDRLVNKYTKEEIDKIICRIFTSISISHNVKNILGVPLQLHIISEILLKDRKTYEEKLDEDIFVLSKMYRIFFQGKYKHLLDTKVEAKHTDRLEKDIDHTLEQYEIAALKTCLDNDTFNKLEIVNSREMSKCVKFLKVLQDDGDKFGIISNVIGDNQALQAIFSHQSFAEYFACVWLKNNVDKLRLIKDNFFYIKYQNLRLMFDIMLAEDNPLHLAVLYKNPEQVKKNLEYCKETDKGGRNALHLICSYGTEYVSRYASKFSRATITCIKIFETLSNCNFAENDDLFHWNCMDYALKCQCLFPFEMDCTRIDDLTEHFNKSDLAFFCAYSGYTNILKALIQKDKSTVKYENLGPRTLLHEAVRGSSETDETDLKQMNIETIKMLVEYGCDINIGDSNKNTLLHLACEGNDFYAADILLKNGVCVNSLNSKNQNALHLALEHKEIDVRLIKLLLDYKVEVNVESNCGSIPLLQAASYPNKDILKLIIHSEANVNVSVANKYGNTPLQQACKAGIYENVIILIDAGADINSVTLHDACEKAHIDFNECFGKRLDINTRDLIWVTGSYDFFKNSIDNDNFNIVNYQASNLKKTHPKIIRFLLNKGINIEDVDSRGFTALQEACWSGNYIAVKELIECGANVKVTTKSKDTLLHLVSNRLYRHESNNITANIIRLLTEKGVNTNDVNENSYTALHESSQMDNYEAAKALIDCGSNVNALTNKNENALHILVQSVSNNWIQSKSIWESKFWYRNTIIIIKLLIASGINVNQKNNNGYIPVQEAVETCIDFSYIEALLDSNTDINIKTSQNETLLHLLIKSYIRNHHNKFNGISEYDTNIINVINLLIIKGLHINEKDADGYTALHLTCKYNKYHLTEVLLNNLIDINEVTKDEKTALHIVVNTDKPDTDIIKLLIERGVDKNAFDKNGYTALHHACINSDEAVVRTLIECKCDVNVLTNQRDSPLHLSVKTAIPEIKILRMLLDNGARVNETDKDEYTALHLACKYVQTIDTKLVTKITPRENHIGSVHQISEETYFPLSNVINLLIRKGADIDATDKEGYTPLHLAYIRVKNSAIQTLLEHKANIHALSGAKETMLHLAAEQELTDPEIIEMLIKNGMGIDAADEYGHTPLHKACLSGNLSTVKILYRENANVVTALTNNNETVLHLAAKRWPPNIHIINFLLQCKVNINAVDKEGYTALHYACKKQALKIVIIPLARQEFVKVSNYDEVKFLVDSGAKVDALTNNNETTLLLALNKPQPDLAIIQLLLSKCEELVNVKDKNGLSPLFLAYKSGRRSILDALLEKNILLDDKTRDLLIEDFPNVLLMGSVKLLELLLKNISNIEEIVIDDTKLIPNFPLHLAKRNGHLQADLLLEMVGYIEEFYTTGHWSARADNLFTYIIKKFEKSSSNSTDDHHPSTSRSTTKSTDVNDSS